MYVAPVGDQLASVLIDDVTGSALHLGQPHLLLVLHQLRPGGKSGAALATLPVPSRGRQRILRKKKIFKFLNIVCLHGFQTTDRETKNTVPIENVPIP
jgi:hypothetical protein